MFRSQFQWVRKEVDGCLRRVGICGKSVTAVGGRWLTMGRWLPVRRGWLDVREEWPRLHGIRVTNWSQEYLASGLFCESPQLAHGGSSGNVILCDLSRLRGYSQDVGDDAYAPAKQRTVKWGSPGSLPTPTSQGSSPCSSTSTSIYTQSNPIPSSSLGYTEGPQFKAQPEGQSLRWNVFRQVPHHLRLSS